MFCRMKHAKTHVLSSKLLTVRCPGLLSVQLHKPPTCSFSTFLIVFAMRWDEPKQDTRIPKTDGAALCDIERASHKPNWALFGSYPWSLRMLSLTLTAILRHEGSTSCIRSTGFIGVPLPSPARQLLLLVKRMETNGGNSLRLTARWLEVYEAGRKEIGVERCPYDIVRRHGPSTY